MNLRPRRGGGPAGRREGSGAPRTPGSDRPPRVPVAVGEEKHRRGGQRGPSRSRFCSGAGKAGCGRSPLRHPPRSRNNSLHRPAPGAPGLAGTNSRTPAAPRVAGGAESRAGLRGTHSAPGPGAALGARGAGTPGRGMGPGGGPGLGSRTPPVPRARPAPAPGPQPWPLPAPHPRPGPRRPRYLGSGPTGRSPRRCHSALRETHTQPQLGPADRPAAAAPLRPAPSSPRSPGPGPGRGQGRRAPGGGG